MFPSWRSFKLLIAAIVTASIGLGITPALADSSDSDMFSNALQGNGEKGTVVRTQTVTSHGVGITGGQHKQLRLLTNGGIQGLAIATSNTTIKWNLSLTAGTRLIATSNSFTIFDKLGRIVAMVDAPWATDASGKAVSTWYSASGTTLLQHVGRGIGRIVADPSLHFCDWWQHLCVKFYRSETRFIADKVALGVGAFATAFCGLIPNAGILIVVKATCAAFSTTYFYMLRNTFVLAKAENRCVELKYIAVLLVLPGLLGKLPISWKRVNC